MADVFISYKREDRARAAALAEALARRGMDVWWDIDLLPGVQFADEIQAVIKRARVAIVLWSALSVRSAYVRAEADLARRREILVPARLDDAELPIPFNLLHTEDLRGWSGDAADPGLSRLLDTVEAKLGRAPRQALLEDEALVAAKMHGDDAEAEFWRAITQKATPAVEEYRLYLQRYGAAGKFVDLAQMRIAELEAQVRAANRPRPLAAVLKLGALAGAVGAVLALGTQLGGVWQMVAPDRPDATLGAGSPSASTTNEASSSAELPLSMGGDGPTPLNPPASVDGVPGLEGEPGARLKSADAMFEQVDEYIRSGGDAASDGEPAASPPTAASDRPTLPDGSPFEEFFSEFFDRERAASDEAGGSLAARAVEDSVARSEGVKLGMKIADIAGDGVLVSEVTPGGLADSRGLRAGDVIHEVGQVEVVDTIAFLEAMQRLLDQGRPSALLLVRTNGEPRFVVIPLED
ncbi:MAG: TIR domain-containing protein [Geminicoccaceae bacterium]